MDHREVGLMLAPRLRLHARGARVRARLFEVVHTPVLGLGPLFDGEQGLFLDIVDELDQVVQLQGEPIAPAPVAGRMAEVFDESLAIGGGDVAYFHDAALFLGEAGAASLARRGDAAKRGGHP